MLRDRGQAIITSGDGRAGCYNGGVELTFLEVGSRAVQTALLLAAPALALSLAAGFVISIFQAVTSIQEQTLTFVPKIFLTGIALVIFGPWMYRVMNDYAVAVFGNLQHYVR